ncbi:hypothetical protein [Kordia sp.]|uniref:hypothetical protein n=1 Tax=Kordia sp. TaxID=1965332 RepID=UPI003B5900E8
MENKWYTISNRYKNLCGNCKFESKGLQNLDHHNSICPNCNIECIWFSFEKDKTLQIIPKYAPEQFQKFISWSQNELDELEFLELIVNIEELAKNIGNENIGK